MAGDSVTEDEIQIDASYNRWRDPDYLVGLVDHWRGTARTTREDLVAARNLLTQARQALFALTKAIERYEWAILPAVMPDEWATAQEVLTAWKLDRFHRD